MKLRMLIVGLSTMLDTDIFHTYETADGATCLQSAVEGSELAQLHALVLITRLVLRLHQVRNHLRRLVHLHAD